MTAGLLAEGTPDPPETHRSDSNSHPPSEPGPTFDSDCAVTPPNREKLHAAELLRFDTELLAWMHRKASHCDAGATGPVSLAGFDEAGRGALAGPVVVGCVCLGPLLAIDRPMGDRGTCRPPRPIDIDRFGGLDDSKKLSPPRREALYERLTAPGFPCGLAWSAGSASAAEIDAMGIVEACRRAALRAWIKLQRKLAAGASLPQPGLVFDRNLSLPDVKGIGYPEPDDQPALGLFDESGDVSPISTPIRTKRDREMGGVSQDRMAVWCTRGDGRSLHVAAASVIAKVTRDRIMSRLADRHPTYGWDRNMGYGTREHREAIKAFGVTPQHRRSFRRAE